MPSELAASTVTHGALPSTWAADGLSHWRCASALIGANAAKASAAMPHAKRSPLKFNPLVIFFVPGIL
jgi:hypothetical protein